MKVRRKHERFVRRLESEFVGQGKTYRAISSDFSRYGLFIRTNHAFAPGTHLDIVIHLPNGTDCQLSGVVRRAMKTPIVSLKNGMGIELVERDRNYIEFLKEFDPAETGESHHTYSPSREDRSGPDISRMSGQKSAAETKQSDDFVIKICPQCSVKNKVRKEKLSLNPKCGKCGAFL